jgi:hypothetical protein
LKLFRDWILRSVGAEGTLPPIAFVFLSALMVNLAVNNYSSAFRERDIGRLLASLLQVFISLGGAVCWSLLAWSVDSLSAIARGEAARKNPGDPEEEFRQMRRLLDPSLGRLGLLLSLAVVFTLSSLAMVPVLVLSNTDTSGQPSGLRDTVPDKTATPLSPLMSPGPASVVIPTQTVGLAESPSLNTDDDASD